MLNLHSIYWRNWSTNSMMAFLWNTNIPTTKQPSPLPSWEEIAAHCFVTVFVGCYHFFSIASFSQLSSGIHTPCEAQMCNHLNLGLQSIWLQGDQKRPNNYAMPVSKSWCTHCEIPRSDRAKPRPPCSLHHTSSWIRSLSRRESARRRRPSSRRSWAARTARPRRPETAIN